MRSSITAALLLAAVAPVTAAAPVLAQESTPDAHLAAALALAEMLNGASQIDKQVDTMLANMAKQAFASDPSLAALNQEYPGADRVFADVLRPIIMAELMLKLPEYNQATANFFAKNFTIAEIGELARFWKTPAARALIHSVSDSLDYDAMTKEIVDQIGDPGGDFEISGGAVAQDKRKAVTAGVDKLTREQQLAIVRFGLTPTGRKLARLAPEKDEIDRQWANSEPSPEAVARIERELPEALLAFMEAEDRKRAAAQ